MTKIVLFVGRFQPFHLGHYRTVLRIRDEGCDEIVIVIGSAQYSGMKHNPFTAKERRLMIEAALGKVMGLKLKVVPVADVHNNDIWVGHVKNILRENGVDSFDAVYTNNPLVKRLFEEAGHYVAEPELVKDEKGVISGTRIREMIAAGDELWKELVTAEVRDEILRIGGVERIEKIFNSG